MFLLPIAVITAMYALYRHRNRGIFGAVSFIFLVYVIMGLSAIVLYVFYEYRDKHAVQIQPMLFLSLCLCISFCGIFSYSDRRQRILVIDNVVLLRRLETFQIVTSIGSIIFFFPFAMSALSGNIGANRWGLARIEEQLGAFGLINTFASLAGNLFFLSILLAFINLATIGRGGTARRAKLLLAASSVNIVYSIAYVGRDGLILWTFTFVFLYLLCRDFMPGIHKRAVKRMARMIAVPSFIGFSLITVSRFSDRDGSAQSDQGSVLQWLFVYGGSQVFNFNDQYVLHATPMGGLVYFKEFVKLTDQATQTSRQYVAQEDWWGDYTSYGVEPWGFQTFIGSFVLDLGRLGALLLTIFLAASTWASLREQARSGVFTFSKLLYFVLLSQVMLFGVFYYRQFSTAYAQIATLLIATTFRWFRSETQMLTIEKVPREDVPLPWSGRGSGGVAWHRI